jgi:hypothetical protein
LRVIPLRGAFQSFEAKGPSAFWRGEARAQMAGIGWKADIAATRDTRIIGTMSPTLPQSVGLGGDGDEIAAIDDVERAFEVKLDKADAVQWHTAGDVFMSLCKALPADLQDGNLWLRFTEVLTDQTGVDPKAIERDSPLLSQSRLWVHVANASAVVWIAAAVGMLALTGWALL